MPFANLSRVLSLLGPVGTLGLIIRKLQRRLRYRAMLKSVPTSHDNAVLIEHKDSSMSTILKSDRDCIVRHAAAMLRDDNTFFTFPYRTKTIERPWNFDPIEQKYWPRRHYTERILHASDTPIDVKIVFEINRFKDLPSLGQAALLTGDKRYADEAEWRMRSWIEDNPFAQSVNWSSALEIAIRLISWSATLTLLKHAGFDISLNPIIARSMYEQSCYLAADMGTDKVVPTNHLIGEAAGLFVLASLFEFPESKRFRESSKKILEKEIIRQTFSDGVTRESSSWYHRFVLHFFDLADRIADEQNGPFSQAYKNRLSKMKSFAGSMEMNGELVRFGDSDDGWALWMPGRLDAWKDFIFGPTSQQMCQEPLFSKSNVIAAHGMDLFLFVRGGSFGMGGAGFSSHAHDDFLSPILFLNGIPILVDPGTYVYNSDPAARVLYRRASSHNGIILADDAGFFSTFAHSKSDFGWNSIRQDAKILDTSFDNSMLYVQAQYGEWPQHTRELSVSTTSATIADRFEQSNAKACEWRYHFDPQWRPVNATTGERRTLKNDNGTILTIHLEGNYETVEFESYDYSPSYRVAHAATALRMTSSCATGRYSVELSLSRE